MYHERKLTSWLLTLALLLLLAPALGGTARAAGDNIEYISCFVNSANKVIFENASMSGFHIIRSDSSLDLPGGTACHIVKSNNITVGSVSVDEYETVRLLLCDNATLTVNNGITLGNGCRLIICVQSMGERMGKLNITGGISGGGTVEIHGGVVTATGDTGGGAGIDGGTVTVYSGVVTATGGTGGGAGIAGGTVNIYGGTVTATGKGGGAGIDGGTVNIYGGTVTAAGGDSGGAGIHGTTTIRGGIVIAAGNGGGAGVGGANNEGGGTVTIHGGVVTATGASGAMGIGAGNGGGGNGSLSVAGSLAVFGGDSAPNAVISANEPKRYMSVAPASVGYVDHNGSGAAVSSTLAAAYVPVTGKTTAWNDGWYVVRGSVAIDERVTVAADKTVNLILCDGATLTARKGVTTTNARLNIYAQSAGTGMLVATGESGGAGIGGANGGNGGTVTIHGGVVTATGNGGGKGIGAGSGGADNGSLTACGGLAVFGGASAGALAAIPESGGDYTRETCMYVALPVSYVDHDGSGNALDKDLAAAYVPVTDASPAVWDAGWYVVRGSATIDSFRVMLSGAVNLILCDGATLNVSALNTTGATLNIYAQSAGTGRLAATGRFADTDSDVGAGIGGKATNTTGGAGGTVNIHGGVITATGRGGAGIGGGNSYGGNGGDGGTVTVYGGTVTARGIGGAGIGGARGSGGHNGGYGGTVTVYGGTVTATGNNGCAGIGGGSGSGDGDGGHGGAVTIHGGAVTATGSGGGAGIGGGAGGIGGSNGGNGTVKNAVRGFGWDNAAGTGAGTPIEVNTSGQQLTYQMVRFPVLTVSFDGNGATAGAMGAQYCILNDTVTLNANAFTRDGKAFAGWNTAADATGTPYANRASFKLTGDLILYAQWTERTTAPTPAPTGSGGGSTPTPPFSQSLLPSGASSLSFDGGKVAVSTASAGIGDIVTLTVTPDAGKRLASLTVDRIGGDAVELQDRGGGVYTFEMPGWRIAIDAVFEPDTGESPTRDETLALLPSGNLAGVVLSPQRITVNGAEVTVEAYNIGGANYFMLRDLAALLRGTPAQFSVTFDAAHDAVVVATGESYDGEVNESFADRSQRTVVSPQTVELDGKAVALTAYNIGGNNFFGLRELAAYLGYTVDYDAASNTAIIESR